MGSDYGGFSYVQSIISIHATRVGSDFLPAGHAATACIFLFTPPVWAATHNGGAYNMRNVFLFTPPVQVATSKPLSVSHDSNISIHATRVGSDLDVCEFLAGELISIHATRVGSDSNIAQYYFIISSLCCAISRIYKFLLRCIQRYSLFCKITAVRSHQQLYVCS